MDKQKTIRRDKWEKFLTEDFINLVREKLDKVTLSKYQAEYLAKETNTKRTEYHLTLMSKAVLWEIGTSDKLTHILRDIIQDTQLDENDIISLKKHLLMGLGIRSDLEYIDKIESKKYYKDEIIKALETTEDRIKYILGQIHKICEYDSVLGAIQNCSYVNSLPKRDRKAIYENKQKFEKIKAKTIEGLKLLKLSYDEVENLDFKEWDPCKYGEEWINYESTLKHIKKVLADDLILFCGTGKRRALEISKIIDYI